MNKTQKDQLSEIKLALEAMGFDDHLQVVTDIQEEAQEAFDNKSERWQESEKGQEAQELIDNLDAAKDALDQLARSLNDAIDCLGKVTD